jgi:hypothetical protein
MREWVCAIVHAMSTSRTLILLAATCMHACVGGDSAGEGDSVPDADPRSGVWSYHDGGIVETSCDSTEMVYVDPDTSFLLTNNGDGSFTIAQGDREDFDCDIDGDDFDCPQRLFEELSVDGVDATVSWQVSVSGEFMGGEVMEGEQLANLACTGTQCELAEVALATALPCSYTVAFTADYGG